MKKILKALLYILLLVIVFLFGRIKVNEDNVIEYISDTVSDTVVFSDIDTIFRSVLIPNEVIVVDTLNVFVKDSSIKFEIVQKEYNEDSSYDLWISGVEPLNLDSIRLFEKKEIKYVTNTVTNTIEENKWKLYAGCGLFGFYDTFVPNIGVCISSPKRMSVMANFGYNENFGKIFSFDLTYNFIKL